MQKLIFGILALAAALALALFLNLGGAVKTAIEAAGRSVLGTEVRVQGMDVSLADKSARMRGLSIANPEGFKTGYLLKTEGVSVTMGEITDKAVTLREIVVDGMTMTYELGARGSNFDVIQKNIKSMAGSQPSGKNGAGKDVIIQQMKIIHAKIVPAIGGKEAPISLPDIVMNNIGSASNPASPAEAAARVMGKIMSASTGAILQSGLGLPAGAGDAVTKAKEGLKSLFSLPK